MKIEKIQIDEAIGKDECWVKFSDGSKEMGNETSLMNMIKIKSFIEKNRKWKLAKIQEKLALSDEELSSLFPYKSINFAAGIDDGRLAGIAQLIQI